MIYNHEEEKKYWESYWWFFETPKLNHTDTPPLTSQHLLILSNQFHQLGPSIQIYESIGSIFIQTNYHSITFLTIQDSGNFLFIISLIIKDLFLFLNHMLIEEPYRKGSSGVLEGHRRVAEPLELQEL